MPFVGTLRSGFRSGQNQAARSSVGSPGLVVGAPDARRDAASSPARVRVRVRVDADGVLVNGARRSVTIPDVLGALPIVRPTVALVAALATNACLRHDFLWTHPLCLLETEDARLVLVGGHDTWSLGWMLLEHTGRPVVLPGWQRRGETRTAAGTAAAIRLLETGLRPRACRRAVVEIMGAAAAPLLGFEERAQRSRLAAVVGISRQALFRRSRSRGSAEAGGTLAW